MLAKFHRAMGMNLLLPILCFAGVAWAKPSTATEAVYLSSAQVQTYKASRPSGAPVAGNDKPDMTHAQILLNHYIGTGQERGGEMHKLLDVLYVVTDGHADVIAGGTLEADNGGPATVQAFGGEVLRGKIVGGHTYSMSPGDVLWMPAGTPHEVNPPKGGSLTVVVVRGSGLSMPPIP